MKKFFTINPGSFLVLLLISLSGSAFAQPYNFSHFDAPYAAFSDGTDVDLTNICNDDELVSVPIGFNFPYYGLSLDTMLVHTTFLLREIEMNGQLHGAQLFPLWLMNECGPNTAISYKTTGTAGSRIFTVQWSNLELSNDPNGEQTLNYQTLLYESDGSIEYRIGGLAIETSSYITDQPGAFTGLIHFIYNAQDDPIVDLSSMSLSGNAANPVSGYYNENAQIYTMTGTPDSSMVYRFAPDGAGLIESAAALFTVSPNPASNTLILNTAGALTGKTIEVVTPGGQVALTTEWQTTQQAIDISSLKNGVYFIRTEGSAIQRFIKQ